MELLESLDFHRVREALAERASTLVGREALLSLEPKEGLEEALAQQAAVAEALAYPYRMGGISDLRPALEAARKGLRLEGVQLREAAASLEAAVALKHELLAVGEHLSRIAQGIGEHAYFLRRVGECLDEAGEVRDEATPRLREIRRRVNPLREQIQQRLMALMDRYPEAVQERFITQRRERYVIPVKASFQHRSRVLSWTSPTPGSPSTSSRPRWFPSTTSSLACGPRRRRRWAGCSLSSPPCSPRTRNGFNPEGAGGP